MAYAVSTSYPNVIRSGDPLLIRLNEYALLAGNNNFWAKFKFGIQFKGYLIYVSGISMPIMEIKFEENQLNGTGGTKRSDAFQLDIIHRSAKAWFDDLEEQLANKPNDDSLKKAIDRFCWQMHYDITESPTNFATTFAEDDFSNVRIDTKTISTFNTLPDTVEEGCVLVRDSIKGTSDGTLSYAMNKVAENLRGTDEYTISKALRDSDDSTAYGGTVRSVSCSVKLQTDVEEANFNEISVNQLGAFGVTNSHRTLYDTVGSYAESGSDTVSDTLDTVSDNIGSSSDSSGTGTVFARLTQVSDSKLGEFGGSNKTLYSTVGSYAASGSSNNISAKLDTIDSNVGTINTSVGSMGTTIGTINTNVSTINTKTTSLSNALIGGATYSSAPTHNVYTALLGSNGAIMSADGFLYANDHTDPFYVTGGSATRYTRYYINTEVSRFALAYNGATQNRPNVGTSTQNPYYNGLRIYSQGDVT